MGLLSKDKEEAARPEVVFDARKMLSRRGGWRKHGYQGTTKSGQPTRCLIQAVTDAGNGKQTLALTLEVINDLYGPGGKIKTLSATKFTSIPSFNDHRSTTKIEVLNVLDEAYKRAGGKEPEVGTMQVMDPKAGDRTIHWDPTRPLEVEDAKASFDFLVKEQGYFAYTVKEEKGKLTPDKQVKTFDETIGRMILRPQLVGG